MPGGVPTGEAPAQPRVSSRSGKGKSKGKGKQKVGLECLCPWRAREDDLTGTAWLHGPLCHVRCRTEVCSSGELSPQQCGGEVK